MNWIVGLSVSMKGKFINVIATLFGLCAKEIVIEDCFVSYVLMPWYHVTFNVPCNPLQSYDLWLWNLNTSQMKPLFQNNEWLQKKASRMIVSSWCSFSTSFSKKLRSLYNRVKWPQTNCLSIQAQKVSCLLYLITSFLPWFC